MNKSTVILLGILVVLAGFAFLILQQPGEQSLTESEKEPFVAVDSAGIVGITITTPSTTVSLTRSGNEWFLGAPNRFRADQKIVGDLLRQIEELTVNSVISENPEKQSLFQVDSTGTRIVLQTGISEDSLGFILGKTGPGMAGVYARHIGDNRVVLVDAGIASVSHRSVEGWRDHTITEIPRDQIKEIGFQYGDTAFTLAWKDSAWFIDDQPAKDWAVNSLVTTLSSFDADGFPDAPPSPMPKPAAILSFAGMEIRFFQPMGDDQYLVTSSSSPQWFQIESWRANQVLKKKKDLLAESQGS